MRPKLILATCLFWASLTAGFLFASATQAQAAEIKFEAQLIWGTNDLLPPNPKNKAVDPEVEKKLKKLPFKWEHYFEIRSKKFTVDEGDSKMVEMSSQCEIKVKNVGGSVVEVHLFGKGKSVGKIGQSLPKGELLVTGGNAENLTAWFVVLKQVE
jgi:hypothetical protein